MLVSVDCTYSACCTALLEHLPNYSLSINGHESQSRFIARCDTSEKFKTVHHVAVFDGGFPF